jgi:hypothetical protein
MFSILKVVELMMGETSQQLRLLAVCPRNWQASTLPNLDMELIDRRIKDVKPR